jgi:hypothetical protein
VRRTQGVKLWTVIFAVLQVLNIVITAVAFVTFSRNACIGEGVSIFCDAAGNVDRELYNLAIGWLVGGLVFGVIELAALAYGLKAIIDFNARKLRRFCIFTAVVLVLQIAFRLMSAGSGYANLLYAIIGAVLLAVLCGWYVWAVKTLYERMERGEITRENPTGMTDYGHDNDAERGPSGTTK